MSCVFVVTPLVVTSWPVVMALAGAAAAQLGFNIVKDSTAVENLTDQETDQSLELEIAQSEVVVEQMRLGESMVIQKEDLRITISRDTRGRVKAEVRGSAARSKQELAEAGQVFLNGMTQQYSYRKVMTELKNKGYATTDEVIEEDGRIRICVRKYE